MEANDPWTHEVTGGGEVRPFTPGEFVSPQMYGVARSLERDAVYLWT